MIRINWGLGRFLGEVWRIGWRVIRMEVGWFLGGSYRGLGGK